MAIPRFAKMAANLDGHPKVRRAGRNGREVFLFVLDATPRELRAVARAVTAKLASRRKPGGVIELPYLDGVQHAAFPEPA